RTHAHQTRLGRHAQRGSRKPIIADPAGRVANGDDLGMRGRIARPDRLIESAPDDLGAERDDGANGNFAGVSRVRGFRQGGTHECLVRCLHQADNGGYGGNGITQRNGETESRTYIGASVAPLLRVIPLPPSPLFPFYRSRNLPPYSSDSLTPGAATPGAGSRPTRARDENIGPRAGLIGANFNIPIGCGISSKIASMPPR